MSPLKEKSRASSVKVSVFRREDVRDFGVYLSPCFDIQQTFSSTRFFSQVEVIKSAGHNFKFCSTSYRWNVAQFFEVRAYRVFLTRFSFFRRAFSRYERPRAIFLPRRRAVSVPNRINRPSETCEGVKCVTLICFL